MNDNIAVLIGLLATQAVNRYRKNPREFEFITIIRLLSRESREYLLLMARGISRGIQ